MYEHVTAAAKTAKIILGAAGLKAALLVKKTSVTIGGHSIPLRRTESIPIPIPIPFSTVSSPGSSTTTGTGTGARATTGVTKQSFVSSSTSTTIFDMSMLTAPPPGFSMYMSNGRKHSINSVGRIARFAADAVLTGSTLNPSDSTSQR